VTASLALNCADLDSTSPTLSTLNVLLTTHIAEEITPPPAIFTKVLHSAGLEMSTVYDYYHTFESRIGYQVLLGGTRHFGYYPGGQWWPFPIGKALRAMEEKLYQVMDLKDATVLDGGAGHGDVAIYMKEKGLRITAIELLDSHVVKAKENVRSRNADGRVEVFQMDYESLKFDDGTFDGVYTMETLVHAGDPDQAMREFYRVLKFGGVVTHFEYEHEVDTQLPSSGPFSRVNSFSAMPAFQQFSTGTIEEKLEKVGFQDVQMEDLSQNVLPLLRLFFFLAYIPYLFIQLLGLEGTFVNTMAAVEFYRCKQSIRYVAVRARKPLHSNLDLSEGHEPRQRRGQFPS